MAISKKKPEAAEEAVGTTEAAAVESEAGTTTAVKKKPAAAKKATAKAKATAETDVIVNIVSEIENMAEDAAISSAKDLLESVDETYFKLGGVLALIQTKSYWEGHGHDSFKAFINAEYGLQYRKAMYLIQIYNDLVESGVAWEKVQGLGWTKLKELSPILNNDNVDALVEKAQTMTVLELIEYIKSLKTPGTAPEMPEAPSSPITTLTFKVHTDQKEVIRATVDKAKEDYGTEYDAVALEHICQSYATGGSNKTKQPSLAELMKAAGVEKVLEIFETCFPGVDLEVTM
jgi:hypothetical protein